MYRSGKGVPKSRLLKASGLEDIMAQIDEMQQRFPEVCEAMVEAGGEAVREEIYSNMPDTLYDAGRGSTRGGFYTTEPYHTPSDGAINVKVYYDGYIETDDGRVIPYPLLVNAFEYGTSDRFTKAGGYRGSITKQPFFRKSFNKAKIEAAMRKVWEEKTKGILNE